VLQLVHWDQSGVTTPINDGLISSTFNTGWQVGMAANIPSPPMGAFSGLAVARVGDTGFVSLEPAFAQQPFTVTSTFATIQQIRFALQPSANLGDVEDAIWLADQSELGPKYSVASLRGPVAEYNYGLAVGGINTLGRPNMQFLRGGVEVSGTVRSFDPKLRNSANAIVGQHVIPGRSGHGQFEQPFTISGITPGSGFTLEVTKPEHTLLRVNNVVIGGEGLNLAAIPLTLRAGDINNDGAVDIFDLNIVLHRSNYNRFVPNVMDHRADLNGDGVINAGDLAILLHPDNFNRGTVELDAEQ
jgi:hypothetical protein